MAELLQAQTDIHIIRNTGVGTRASSLANNFVSLSNDLSGIYWNPAALSFSLVREFQVSVDALDLNSQSEFHGTEISDNLRRIKLNNTGLMIAVPAEKGGLTFALAYNNPVVFDDISRYSGQYDVNSQNYIVKNQYKTSGGLKYWTGGFGLQVAPGAAAGLSASLVSGRENAKQFTNVWIDHQLDSSNFFYDDDIEGKYLGYDITGGLLYKRDLFSAGFRISFPQVMTLTEEYTGPLYPGETSVTSKYKAKIYSSYSGAAGFSLTLPFLTLSTEGRYTLPFNYVFPSEDIPQSSQANFFKLGGGVGVELPLVVLPVLIRAGYSYDELDLHHFAYKYKGEDIDWSDGGISVDRNINQFTAGLGFAGSSASFDLSYSLSIWALSADALKQDYKSHRVMASFAIRY